MPATASIGQHACQSMGSPWEATGSSAAIRSVATLTRKWPLCAIAKHERERPVLDVTVSVAVVCDQQATQRRRVEPSPCHLNCQLLDTPRMGSRTVGSHTEPFDPLHVTGQCSWADSDTFDRVPGYDRKVSDPCVLEGQRLRYLGHGLATSAGWLATGRSPHAAHARPASTSSTCTAATPT